MKQRVSIIVAIATLACCLMLRWSALPSDLPESLADGGASEAQSDSQQVEQDSTRRTVAENQWAGRRRDYRFKLHQSVDVGGQGGSEDSEAADMDLEGTYSETLCQITERGSIYQLEVTGLAATQGSSSVTGLPQLGSSVLRLLLGTDGHVKGYCGHLTQSAKLPRMLFLRLHTLPKAHRNEWQAEDETGRCDFAFHYDSRKDGLQVVIRTKKKIELTKPSQVPTVIDVKESQDRLIMDKGEVHAATCRERLCIDAGGIRVDAAFGLEMDCIRQTAGLATELAGLEFQPWPEMVDEVGDQTPPTLEEALGGLRSLAAQGELGSLAMQRLFAGLVERFRSDPLAVQDVVRRLLAGEMSEPNLPLEVAGLFVSALADAAALGSGACLLAIQDLVLELHSGDLLGAMGRALHQLSSVDPALVRPVLLVATNRLQALGPSDDPQGDIAMALGTLMKVVGAESPEAQQAIVVLRSRAVLNGDCGLLVSVVCACGNAMVIEAVALPLANHVDASVRVRVMEAMSLCSASSRCRSAIADAVFGDTDSGVRVAAIQAMGTFGGHDAAAMLRRCVTTDTDVSVRIAALRMLGRSVDSDTRAVIQAVARQDTDPGIRRIAEELLGRQ